MSALLRGNEVYMQRVIMGHNVCDGSIVAAEHIWVSESIFVYDLLCLHFRLLQVARRPAIGIVRISNVMSRFNNGSNFGTLSVLNATITEAYFRSNRAEGAAAAVSTVNSARTGSRLVLRVVCL